MISFFLLEYIISNTLFSSSGRFGYILHMCVYCNLHICVIPVGSIKEILLLLSLYLNGTIAISLSATDVVHCLGKSAIRLQFRRHPSPLPP